MKKITLFYIFRSHYCKVCFFLGLILGYSLLPKEIFLYTHKFVAGIFLLLFALVITCLVRSIKERIVAARKYSASSLGLIASIIGLAAFHACGVGAPMCGAAIGVGFVGIFFPAVVSNFISLNYGIFIYLAIFMQLISLYFLKCLKLQVVKNI